MLAATATGRRVVGSCAAAIVAAYRNPNDCPAIEIDSDELTEVFGDRPGKLRDALAYDVQDESGHTVSLRRASRKLFQDGSSYPDRTLFLVACSPLTPHRELTSLTDDMILIIVDTTSGTFICPAARAKRQLA